MLTLANIIRCCAMLENINLHGNSPGGGRSTKQLVQTWVREMLVFFPMASLGLSGYEWMVLRCHHCHQVWFIIMYVTYTNLMVFLHSIYLFTRQRSYKYMYAESPLSLRRDSDADPTNRPPGPPPRNTNQDRQPIKTTPVDMTVFMSLWGANRMNCLIR